MPVEYFNDELNLWLFMKTFPFFKPTIQKFSIDFTVDIITPEMRLQEINNYRKINAYTAKQKLKKYMHLPIWSTFEYCSSEEWSKEFRFSKWMTSPSGLITIQTAGKLYTSTSFAETWERLFSVPLCRWKEN